MANLQLPAPPVKDFNAAKRQFVELYGSIAVMNTYLKIALLVVCLICLGLLLLNLRSQEHVRHVRPIVIRINEVGRAEAVAYANLEYRPQEGEIKYFLIQFVQQHYGRVRATVRDNYARSLYFLDGRLANAIIEADKKAKTFETFLTDQTDEIEIRVHNVAIEDLRKSPYRATVDFEKVFYSASDRAEKKRERYVGNFVFMVKDRVPNAMIPVNPLGLTITYFRQDQAF